MVRAARAADHHHAVSVQRDARGCRVTGASGRALDHYERALEGFLAWTGDPVAAARRAREEAPGFVMGHVLEAQLHLCSRDPSGAGAARAGLERASALPQDARERMHLAALATSLSGEFDRARGHLACVLEHAPRDLLALAVAHTIDHYVGDSQKLRARVAAVLPAWSRDDPGYHGVLAMHAFGLEESGDYARAEEAALAALELEPRDIRAHHARCHVLEMQGRAAEGVRWMGERGTHWTDLGAASTHLWWHLALYHLELGDARHALDIYDRRIGGATLNERIDSSALLWRLQLRGVAPEGRWRALAERWAPQAEDAFCAFNDVHAMLAFVGAGRRDLQRQLLRAQRRRLARGGTNGGMLRDVGIPACEALRAYGEGRYARAAELLATLPAVAHRLGGSHAQRGIIGLTLRHAQRKGDSPHFSQLQMRKIGTVPI
jgi:tetratricopeptide (TPR) repeat protein